MYKGEDKASESVVPPLKSASTSSAVFQFSVQAGCAAALLCVEEQYCTLEGVISPEPVELTSKQLLRRVPLSVRYNFITHSHILLKKKHFINGKEGWLGAFFRN